MPDRAPVCPATVQAEQLLPAADRSPPDRGQRLARQGTWWKRLGTPQGDIQLFGEQGSLRLRGGRQSERGYPRPHAHVPERRCREVAQWNPAIVQWQLHLREEDHLRNGETSIHGCHGQGLSAVEMLEGMSVRSARQLSQAVRNQRQNTHQGR
ncbi:hypothetical protein BH79_28185 [Pseudomonas aeruginosa C0324C]|nr:hypothetical protein DQ20_00390 [Pseudomonas aeruginosa]KEA15508.1 hypothetical protein BH77_25995 [Pseudomonas aeruginosa C2773C]KEA19073.1 hypothetical protein Y905_09985 [Pseudomonas aeruginosa C2159M]KEA24043.1 hypothetical protein BH79_28185 [Pseudomonas aeruginosa C0324C]